MFLFFILHLVAILSAGEAAEAGADDAVEDGDDQCGGDDLGEQQSPERPFGAPPQQIIHLQVVLAEAGVAVGSEGGHAEALHLDDDAVVAVAAGDVNQTGGVLEGARAVLLRVGDVDAYHWFDCCW